MATVSKANLCEVTTNICQGDVFRDVKYSYIDAEGDETVEIVEFTFPMAIIISQACDVNSMGEMVTEQSGKATKFMPSILLCPIYDVDVAKKTEHVNDALSTLHINKLDGSKDVLFNSGEFGLAKNDWHYRYHALTVKIGKDTVLENTMIDFKHYFSVPASYLIKNREKRLFHLDDLFAEQITLKFATYLSRVAIP